MNRNNYVAYINMVIPMTLALGAYCHSLSQRRNTRPVVSGSDSSHLVYFMAAIMAGSTFLSGSRAGIIICGGLVGAWIIKAVNTSVGRWRQSRSFSWGRFLIPFSLVTMILAAVLAAMGVEHIVAQTARTQTALSELTTHGGRMDAYRGTLAMFSDHWLYGSGAGAFSSLFPFYQPEGVSGWLRYAHSDWLQWFAELGMVGSIFAVAALWSAFRMSHTSCHLPSAPRSFPLFLAVCGVSLHAWVDFPLHIPGVATLAVALLALLSLPMAQTNPESHITDYHQCNPT